MKVTYLDAAKAEFEEAIQCYNDQRAGLGFELADQVKQAIERIRNYPRAWTSLSKRTRRCLIHRFPYRIIYEARTDVIIIVAIQHHRRKPNNWRDRPYGGLALGDCCGINDSLTGLFRAFSAPLSLTAIPVVGPGFCIPHRWRLRASRSLNPGLCFTPSPRSSPGGRGRKLPGPTLIVSSRVSVSP
jgi:plasmid stabilization system protein ParE